MKLSLTDTPKDILTKMSNGNPGCISFLMGVLNNSNEDFFYCCLKLDSMEMYGSEIYQLWNDCCDRDTDKTIQIIRTYSNKEIISHVRNGKARADKFEDMRL